MTLYNKYRPKSFKGVVGQAGILKRLPEILEKRAAHAFLLHGPSGCGKTTVARICAKKLGCAPHAIREVDGATHTGIDAVRALQESVRYRPLGGSPARAVIVDEAHRLSGAAWDAMLKILEEPPSHLFWFICTTNPKKIPQTIHTRCHVMPFREVSPNDLQELLEDVAKKEGIDLDDQLISYIASKSLGSPRRALVNLEACRDAKDKKDVASRINQIVEEDAILQFCQFIVSKKRRTWAAAMEKFEKIEKEPAESIRIVMVRYLAGCLRKAEGDDDATHFLSILENWAEPYHDAEGHAPLLLSIGRTLLAE